MAEEVKSKVEEAIPSMDDFKEELEESFRQHSTAKRSDMAAWDKIMDDFEKKANVEVEIREAVKSGVTTSLEGVRAFIPASKLSLGFVEEKDLPNWVGKRLEVRIITADPENNKLVLSAREILREEAQKKQQEKMAKLQVGLVTEGKVESLKDYGAFVDIGDGITGLLHVSQISNKRVKSPADVLKEGQTITVMVTKVADGRISLSMKALEADRAEKQERRERDDFRENYRENGAVTTSLGSLLKNISFD
ncbi:MAG: S1 RNA-binding domain-containing protein [Oribacterium sp.]